jgi:hypothetical protein
MALLRREASNSSGGWIEGSKTKMTLMARKGESGPINASSTHFVI